MGGSLKLCLGMAYCRLCRAQLLITIGIIWSGTTMWMFCSHRRKVTSTPDARKTYLTRISHNVIEKGSLFWYNLLKTRKLAKRQGAVL